MFGISGKAVVLESVPTASGDARRGGNAMPLFLNGRLCDEDCDRRLAFLLCHPAGNFTTHYLLPHLERHGGDAMGMATRYTNNELELTMELCIQDLARGVEFLRGQGFEKVVLLGNSGGGSISCLYQAEAENPTITTFPDGEPLEMGSMPAVDGIVLFSPHPSRALVLTDWLDPAILDENDPSVRDPELDLFIDRGLPLDREWVAQYREAQLRRNRQISEHAIATMKRLREDPSGPADQIMTTRGTGADPRFIDITLDPNGRPARSIELTRRLNSSHLSMGRLSTMRAWLSQWSVDHSRADGPSCFSRTSVPSLLIEHGNDEIVFPSYFAAYREGRPDVQAEVLPGATHFMIRQEELKDQLARRIVRWARDLF